MLVLPIEDIFAIGILLPLVKPQKILIRFSFYLFCNNNHMDEISQYPPSLPISVQKPNIHPFTKRSMSQYTNNFNVISTNNSIPIFELKNPTTKENQ